MRSVIFVGTYNAGMWWCIGIICVRRRSRPAQYSSVIYIWLRTVNIGIRTSGWMV